MTQITLNGVPIVFDGALEPGTVWIVPIKTLSDPRWKRLEKALLIKTFVPDPPQ